MKNTLRGIGAATIAASIALLGVGALSMTEATATQPNPDHKVTICHRTDSNTNPYVIITVDIASTGYLKAGHNGDPSGKKGHTGPIWNPTLKDQKIKWGDIIPAYTYTPKATKKNPNPVTFTFAGYNNTEQGLAILANGCKITTSETPTPTETSETPTPTPTETTATPTPTETSETPTPTPTEPTPLCTEPNMPENLPCPTKYDTPTPTPTKTSETPVPHTVTPTPSYSELGGCPVPLTNGKCVLPKTGSSAQTIGIAGTILALLGGLLTFLGYRRGAHV